MGEFEFNWTREESSKPQSKPVEGLGDNNSPEQSEVFPQEVLEHPIVNFIDGMKSIDKLPKENTIMPDKPLHILQAERIVEEKSKRDQGDILNW